MAGRRLADRYELEEVLARGGMGVVWRGRDLRLDRAVAVKLVAGSVLTDPTVVERFDREARTVARLNHPNIVAVYDFGTDLGDSYLVMELVEGRSVAAMIRDGQLPISEAVAVAAQTCAGLAAAHRAGVVHRDVKPANLIRTPAGIVKICDFGIAHLQNASARLTATAMAMGSTSYMSPEQVNGDPVDARTDLYGLGCTVFAMLTGAPPFVGTTPLSVVHQHVTESPPDVRTVRPDVPAPLAALVDELLAKSPEDRPGDALAVARRLAAPPAEPLAPAVDGAPAPRKRVWGMAAIGVGALVAVVLTALLAATRGGGSPSVAAPAAPTASASASVPAPAPPSPTSPRPAPSTSSARVVLPAPPVNPVADLRRIIEKQVAAGQLKPKEAGDLRKRVDEIARRLERDDPGVEKKIGELRNRLAELRRQDKLTEAGYRAMSRAVAALRS
ncbi:serine/threonine-protein kinase [Asanoa sp. NPDC049518]|uniref:serine/threonine-protein kinase n=1 Tax=unclassified Asanoa TaxID=2685164 RepID=UPI0034431D0A